MSYFDLARSKFRDVAGNLLPRRQKVRFAGITLTDDPTSGETVASVDAAAGNADGVLVSELASTPITADMDGQVRSATGKLANGDGGGGLFYARFGDATTDNGWECIAATGGRWRRIIEGGQINVKWFGARGDFQGPGIASSTDDIAAFRAALEAARLYILYISSPSTAPNYGGSAEIVIPPGNYRLGDMLSMDTLVDGTAYSHIRWRGLQGGCSANSTVNLVFSAGRLRGPVTFTAVNGTVVPAGTAMTIGGVTFATVASATASGGKVTVEVVSSATSTAQGIAAGTAATLSTPISGVTSPTTGSDGVVGSGIWSVAISMRCRDDAWENVRICPLLGTSFGKLIDLDQPVVGLSTNCRFSNVRFFTDRVNFGSFYRGVSISDYGVSNSDLHQLQECSFSGYLRSGVWIASQNSKNIDLNRCYFTGYLFSGILRGPVTFTATNGTVVPAGTAMTIGGIAFTTLATVTAALGKAIVEVTSGATSTRSIPIGAVATLSAPITGVTSPTVVPDGVSGTGISMFGSDVGIEHETGHFIATDCQYANLKAGIELGAASDDLVIYGGSTEQCKQYLRTADGIGGAGRYCLTQIGGRFICNEADPAYGAGNNQFFQFRFGGPATLIGVDFNSGPPGTVNGYYAAFSVQCPYADVTAIGCSFPNDEIAGSQGPFLYCDKRIEPINCYGRRSTGAQYSIRINSGRVNCLGSGTAAIGDGWDAVMQSAPTIDGVTYADYQVFRLTLLMPQPDTEYTLVATTRSFSSTVSAAQANVLRTVPGLTHFDVVLQSPLTAGQSVILDWRLAR